MELILLDNIYRGEINSYITKEWGNPIVTRGNIIDTTNLPGFVAVHNGELAGGILYHIKDNDCEIAALFSLKENLGVGTGLIDAVIAAAKSMNCRRVWLITMNDNTHAIRFYQKRGFALKAVHINAFKETQRIKNLGDDVIIGIDGIPILHEFEFEIILQ